MAIQTANRLLASLKFLETHAELKNPKIPFQAVVLNQRNLFDLTGLNEMFSDAKANYPSLVPISNLWEEFYKELVADSLRLDNLKSNIHMLFLELKYKSITAALEALNIEEFSQEALKKNPDFSTTDLVLVPDAYPKDQMLKNQITQSDFNAMVDEYNELSENILYEVGDFRLDLSNKEFLNFILDSFKLILTRKVGRDFLETLLSENFVCKIVQGNENRINYIFDEINRIDACITLNSDFEKSFYQEFYVDGFSASYELAFPHFILFHELIHLLHNIKSEDMREALTLIPCPFYTNFEELVSIRGWYNEPFFIKVLKDHFAQKENSQNDFEEILSFLNSSAETDFEFTENRFCKDWGFKGRASHKGLYIDEYLCRHKKENLFFKEILFSIDSTVENLFLEHLKVEDFIKLYEQTQENWDKFTENEKKKINLEKIKVIYDLLLGRAILCREYIASEVAKLTISIQKKELFVQFIMKRLGIA